LARAASDANAEFRALGALALYTVLRGTQSDPAGTLEAMGKAAIRTNDPFALWEQQCDGATYHSSYTARDRDRLRQQQLEKLGWTFHRIWSTDWFLRRDEEIDRAVRAFHSATEKSDRGDDGASQKQAPVDAAAAPSVPATPASGRSSPAAPISVRESIGDYSATELQNLLRWVKSDGKLRTNDELADEMFEALPFSRRGSKIDAAIRRAIARS
jgi:REase_MTES_1575